MAPLPHSESAQAGGRSHRDTAMGCTGGQDAEVTVGDVGGREDGVPSFLKTGGVPQLREGSLSNPRWIVATTTCARLPTPGDAVVLPCPLGRVATARRTMPVVRRCAKMWL